MRLEKGRAWLCLCAIVLLAAPSAGVFGQDPFLRGDIDCDGSVSLVDGYLIFALLTAGYVPPCNCEAACDADGNLTIDTTDGAYLFIHLIQNGPAPPAPYPTCGPWPAGGFPCADYPDCPLFKRGDANGDGCVNEDDATYINDFLFTMGPAPACMLAADADDNEFVEAADATYILAYCNTGGPPPPAPGPTVCGDDPTPGALTCGSYTTCCQGCANQLPGDCNQDGALDISDAVHLLGFIFLGSPATLPCGDGGIAHPSNGWLMSVNGPLVAVMGPVCSPLGPPPMVPELTIDLADAVYLLQYLFNNGPPPVQGTACIYIEDCPQNPFCPLCPP